MYLALALVQRPASKRAAPADKKEDAASKKAKAEAKDGHVKADGKDSAAAEAVKGEATDDSAKAADEPVQDDLGLAAGPEETKAAEKPVSEASKKLELGDFLPAITLKSVPVASASCGDLGQAPQCLRLQAHCRRSRRQLRNERDEDVDVSKLGRSSNAAQLAVIEMTPLTELAPALCPGQPATRASSSLRTQKLRPLAARRRPACIAMPRLRLASRATTSTVSCVRVSLARLPAKGCARLTDGNLPTEQGQAGRAGQVD